jgi:cytochrome P450
VCCLGWRVCAGLVSVNLDPNVYSEPFRFDPERFSPSRAEHKRSEFAFVPQGHPNPHISHGCAGIEVLYLTFLLSVYLYLLSHL